MVLFARTCWMLIFLRPNINRLWTWPVIIWNSSPRTMKSVSHPFKKNKRQLWSTMLMTSRHRERLLGSHSCLCRNTAQILQHCSPKKDNPNQTARRVWKLQMSPWLNKHTNLFPESSGWPPVGAGGKFWLPVGETKWEWWQPPPTARALGPTLQPIFSLLFMENVPTSHTDSYLAGH